jgi:glycosyltransferase involved in cell wall biosynthesis
METVSETTGIQNNNLQAKIPKMDISRGLMGTHSFPKKQMNILHITTTDPAGAGYNLVRALNEHTNHRARIITTHPNVFAHPDDISTAFDFYDEFEAILVQADVLHFHKIDEDFEISLPTQSSRQRSWKIKDFLRTGGKNKQIVYHIHGHPYERANVKENGEKYAEKKLGRILTSTPDLESMYRCYCDARWFPNCVPINDIRYLPRATNKMIRARDDKDYYFVAQTVSDPHLKNVKEIVEAIKSLEDIYPVKYFPISGMKFDTAIKVKRHSHIIFDHIQGYYGLGSLEGLSMGKPVIAGLNDYCLKRIFEFFDISDTPWQVARTVKDIRDVIFNLLADPEKMKEVGEYSRKFMEEVWSDKAIGRRLASFYESL